MSRPPSATLNNLMRKSVTAKDPPVKTRDRRPDLNADRRHVNCGCGRRKLKDWAYTPAGLIICTWCFYAALTAAEPAAANP